MKLVLHGELGAVYEIRTADNLDLKSDLWPVLARLTNTLGTATVLDPTLRTERQPFYAAHLVP